MANVKVCDFCGNHVSYSSTIKSIKDDIEYNIFLPTDFAHSRTIINYKKHRTKIDAPHSSTIDICPFCLLEMLKEFCEVNDG